MLVLLSNLTGIILTEWKGCRRKTYLVIVAALAVLVLAVFAFTYGNYLGNPI
jgi:VIT1/CCC1 family predicted Fe2+/Mn2+ transporter